MQNVLKILQRNVFKYFLNDSMPVGRKQVEWGKSDTEQRAMTPLLARFNGNLFGQLEKLIQSLSIQLYNTIILSIQLSEKNGCTDRYGVNRCR